MLHCHLCILVLAVIVAACCDTQTVMVPEYDREQILVDSISDVNLRITSVVDKRENGEYQDSVTIGRDLRSLFCGFVPYRSSVTVSELVHGVYKSQFRSGSRPATVSIDTFYASGGS